MDIKFIQSNQYLYALRSKPTRAFSKHLKQTEIQWSWEGPKIIRALEKITELKFKKTCKRVYVNSKYSFSDPLTLKISSSINDNIDNLTHELIHVLLTENYPKMKRRWSAYWNSLGDEPFLVKSHVMVHAIHMCVARRMRFSKNRIKMIKTYSQHPDYQRAWKLAKQKGYGRVVRLIHMR